MNSLFIDRRGVSLRIDGQALTVLENSGRIQAVPLAPLKRVYIHGDVSFDTSLLSALGERGIGVGIMHGPQDEIQLLMPVEGKDAQRRLAQYRMSVNAEKCLEYARYLMRAKCASQSGLLTEWAGIRRALAAPLKKSAQRIQAIAWGPMKTCESLDVLRGLEGAAAAIYFEALGLMVPAELNFNNRNRRPPKDPFNAMLSLGYSLLQCEATLALRAAGLDPYNGFYHVPVHGRPSLACDLMEPGRVAVDRLCLQLVLTGALTATNFTMKGKRCELLKSGRSVFFPAYEGAMEEVRKDMWARMRDMGKWIQGRDFDFEAVSLSDLEDDGDG